MGLFPLPFFMHRLFIGRLPGMCLVFNFINGKPAGIFHLY